MWKTIHEVLAKAGKEPGWRFAACNVKDTSLGLTTTVLATARHKRGPFRDHPSTKIG